MQLDCLLNKIFKNSDVLFENFKNLVIENFKIKEVVKHPVYFEEEGGDNRV